MACCWLDKATSEVSRGCVCIWQFGRLIRITQKTAATTRSWGIAWIEVVFKQISIKSNLLDITRRGSKYGWGKWNLIYIQPRIDDEHAIIRGIILLFAPLLITVAGWMANPNRLVLSSHPELVPAVNRTFIYRSLTSHVKCQPEAFRVRELTAADYNCYYCVVCELWPNEGV